MEFLKIPLLCYSVLQTLLHQASSQRDDRKADRAWSCETSVMLLQVSLRLTAIIYWTDLCSSSQYRVNSESTDMVWLWYTVFFLRIYDVQTVLQVIIVRQLWSCIQTKMQCWLRSWEDTSLIATKLRTMSMLNPSKLKSTPTIIYHHYHRHQ